MRKFSFFSKITLCAVIIIFMAGCGDKLLIEVNKDLIEDYFDKDQQLKGEQLPPNVYVDFSDGMVQAYTSNSDNAKILESITQKLTGTDICWFGLGGGEIKKLDYPSTQLYNKVTDPKSYSTEIMAPIEGALIDILKNGVEALLITDFEEYTPDKKEQFENFAKSYFTDWIKKGNSIEFIITNYQEKTKDKRIIEKHLYFIVFNTPNSKLLKDIDYALEGRGYTFERFSLTNKICSLSNNYGGVKKAGVYYDEKGDDITTAINFEDYSNGLLKDKMYEFLPLRMPWTEVFNNSKSLMQEGTPKPFKDFLRNLFVDFSQATNYQIDEVELRVTDITLDYSKYFNSKEARKFKPEFAKNDNGETIVSNYSDENISKFYETNGELKTEYIYSPEQYPTIEEMFILNKSLFENNFQDDKSKVEIAVKFHENFTGILQNPNAIIRIDVVVKKCTPIVNNLTIFEWESTTNKSKKNTSLSEAIRNTLDNINPKGVIIYSYFIYSPY